MTLDEAVAEFEKGFTVWNELGCVTPPLLLRDTRLAPSGDKYVALTSGGVESGSGWAPTWFPSEGLAVDAWLREAWSYADKRVGRNLFWAERPTYFCAEFVAVDQVAMINHPAGRNSIALKIGYVRSRFVISANSKPGKSA